MTLLSGVIELLEVFNVFTTFIQANEYPTMNTFVLFHTEIQESLTKIIDTELDDVIVKAAEILLSNMEKRLPLTIEFIGAALLDVRMQRLPAIQQWLNNNGTILFYFIYDTVILYYLLSILI